MKIGLLFVVLITFAPLSRAQTFAITPNNVHFCYTGTIIIAPCLVQPPGVQGATSYSWGIISSVCNPTSTPTSPNGSTALLSFPCIGVYTISCIAFSGSSVIAAASTTAEVDPFPTLVVNASPTSGCVGSTFTLTPLGGYSFYNWGTLPAPSGTITGMGGTVIVTPTASTCYTVVAVDAGGCQTTAAKCVTIIPNPTVIVNATQTICSGASATLIASGASTYTWSNNVASSTIAVSPTSTSSYTVTGAGSDPACLSKKIATVTVNNCTSLDELLSADASQLSIYPNPFKGEITLESQKCIKILIYDNLGHIVMEESYQPGKHTISTEKLNGGIYFMQATDVVTIKKTRLCRLDFE
jgi:hypothetical protein